MPVSRVRKILRNILQLYPFKLPHAQELVPGKREAFALQFLARIEVDNVWPCNIFWTEEARFHLQGPVNTQNCRMWARENPFQMQPLPLHFYKFTVCCGFKAGFIVDNFFLEEIDPSGHVQSKGLAMNLFCATNSFQHCKSADVWKVQFLCKLALLRTPVKQLLNLHFGNYRIICRHFPTAWTPRLPDLNPCDFWLWVSTTRVRLRT
ncbi:hypothetical protein AVEN_33912-1 [Araneus ventricosus]|uniref:Uncharacterized protein n=1 Tax=Araneus ventricosus TaxID=182803 RepID=A0A4Y1ZMJ0_ARAVE|nr:hypothetical protein AVEN_33912-1 [Araneus ventricosus]